MIYEDDGEGITNNMRYIWMDSYWSKNLQIRNGAQKGKNYEKKSPAANVSANNEGNPHNTSIIVDVGDLFNDMKWNQCK